VTPVKHSLIITLVYSAQDENVPEITAVDAGKRGGPAVGRDGKTWGAARFHTRHSIDRCVLPEQSNADGSGSL